ncbi:hypothetical protein [Halapricum desulfuricans]|uniref:Endonuclease Nob1, consists of a PIN domain and a Zn-ribbon module n=1 Tax=Halapricum desulfuricans TaxID=2841257 RepID=A0A897NMS5_9EURY|nr:hypothetical protein [Halapricum desulfuricans]QSG14047.1 Endonuclease Nob1, consists of a PIN domain and a Zn-ribbon module [Halapricum desulfuricans]
MTLGIEVERAVNGDRGIDPELLVYGCEGCGRAFAREHESCPACGGAVDSVLLY